MERGEAIPAGGLGARLRLPLHPALPRRHGDRARGRQQLSKTSQAQDIFRKGKQGRVSTPLILWANYIRQSPHIFMYPPASDKIRKTTLLLFVIICNLIDINHLAVHGDIFLPDSLVCSI